MKNPSRKKGLWGFLSVVSIIVFICCTAYIAKHYMHDDANDGSNFRDTTITNTNVNGDPQVPAKDTHEINWKKLAKTNSDIYAWLYVPGTKVDYPVVRPTNGEDDDYYLNRNIKKESSSAGSIYSEMQNAPDFSDPVTVLYGHNMADGSMMASLHHFRDSGFFKKHKYMYIYTPERKLTYEIYAAYVYDNRHILNSFDFSKKKVFRKYLKFTQKPTSMVKNTRSLKKEGIQLSENNKILTLSTCTYSYEGDTRYLVQGVLVKDEQ